MSVIMPGEEDWREISPGLIRAHLPGRCPVHAVLRDLVAPSVRPHPAVGAGLRQGGGEEEEENQRGGNRHGRHLDRLDKESTALYCIFRRNQ